MNMKGKIDLNSLNEKQIKNLVNHLIELLTWRYNYNIEMLARRFRISKSYFSKIRNNLTSPQKETKIKFIDNMLKEFDLQVLKKGKRFIFKRSFKRKIQDEYSFYCFFLGDRVLERKILQLRIEFGSHTIGHTHLLYLNNSFIMSGYQTFGRDDYSNIQMENKEEGNLMRFFVKNFDKIKKRSNSYRNPFSDPIVTGIYFFNDNVRGQFVAIKKRRGYSNFYKEILYHIESNGFPDNFEPIRINSIKEFKDALENPKNYSKTINLELPKELFTAYQQFLNFFQYYVQEVKGKDITFYTIRRKEKLEIKISPIFDQSYLLINSYLNEYLNLVFQESKKFSILFNKKVSKSQENLLIKELKQQIRNLNKNLGLARAKNKNLKSNLDLLKELIVKINKASEINIERQNIILGHNKIFNHHKHDSMKIENQNIYGGSQQFADMIINKSQVLNETDSKFLQLIGENTDTLEEKKRLVESLENIKSPQNPEIDKRKSGGILRKFFDSIASESGKQLVQDILKNGEDYIQFIS